MQYFYVCGYFCKKKYNKIVMSKRNALSPLVWGPKTWFFLESTALGYPENPSEEEKEAAKKLLTSLEYLLPCGTCRYHFGEFLKKYQENISLDDIVGDRYSFITFLIEAHNDVRIRNGSAPRTVGDVFTYYQAKYLGNDLEKFEKMNNIDFFTDDILKTLIYHFNPITLLIGIVIGLFIFKLYNDYHKKFNF